MTEDTQMEEGKAEAAVDALTPDGAKDISSEVKEELHSQAAEAAAVPDEATPPPAGTAGGGHWYDALADESLRSNPNITKYASLDAFAKGHAEAVKKLGQKGFAPPPPANAAPETRAAYNALRRGENVKSIDDYSYGKGETSEGLVQLKQALFDAGADDYMATQVLTSLEGTIEKGDAEDVRQGQAFFANEENLLREHWNEDYLVKRKAVDVFLNKPEHASIANRVRGLGLDRCADFNVMMDELLNRGSNNQVVETRGDMSRQGLKEMIADISRSEAYRDQWNKGHKAAALQRAELIERLRNTQR